MENDKNYQISISPAAAKQVKIQFSKRGTPNAYLRLGVKGSGCSGFSYLLQFEETDLKINDIVFNVSDINVVIDHKSIIYLNGCTLDWEKTLIHQGFKFINPNVKSSCGCGSSVSF